MPNFVVVIVEIHPEQVDFLYREMSLASETSCQRTGLSAERPVTSVSLQLVSSEDMRA